MTVLSVVRDVCEVVGVLQPPSIFSGITSNRTMQEMLALANEMAQRITYDLRDWTLLKKAALHTGDGVTTSFNLPADYKRMLLTANVRKSTAPKQPLRFIPDYDVWLERRLANETDGWGEWTIVGGKLLIFPPPAGPIAGPPAIPAVTISYPYIDKNCVNVTGGTLGTEFLNDTDTFRLDERLLKLGMIYQWKSNKGSPYAEDMGTYGDALSLAMGKDGPSPIFIDRLPVSSYARSSYPWPVPT